MKQQNVYKLASHLFRFGRWRIRCHGGKLAETLSLCDITPRHQKVWLDIARHVTGKPL